MLDTTAALTQGALLAFIGMGVVFSALILISVILTNFDLIDKVIQIKPYEHGGGHHAPPPPAKVEKVEPTKEVEEGISPQTVAAICAAVAVATGKKIKISRIRYRREPVQPTWATHGRATVMAPHTYG